MLETEAAGVDESEVDAETDSVGDGETEAAGVDEGEVDGDTDSVEVVEAEATADGENEMEADADSVEDGDAETHAGVAPTLGLGLAEAASAPTAVFRPHHCGSATVATRSQPEASRRLEVTLAGAGPHA